MSIPGYCTSEGCDRPAGRSGLCETCSKIERDRERDKTRPQRVVKPLKRTGYVKPVSEKRKEENKEYAVLRDAYLKEHPVCEVCGSSPATEIHHKKGRTNDLLCEIQYFLAVDNECHRFITDDSAWAIREGYSLPRNHVTEKPTI